MSTYSNFGLTPSDITARLTNTVINASTPPTTTQVQAMIDLIAAEVCGEAEAQHIVVAELTAGSREYSILKSMTLYKAIAEFLVTTQRGIPDAGKYYIDQYYSLRKTLRDSAVRVANTGKGPNLTDYSSLTDNNRTNTFQYTIAGKIIRGGM